MTRVVFFVTIFLLFSFATSLSGAKWSALKILQTGREAYEKLTESVREGAKLGLTECKKQFSYEKWNCSITFRNKRLADMPIFIQSSLPLANKETAFVHSISAAGVTYRLTQDCRRGKFENCDCVQSKKKSAKEWGGCHDNFKFGDTLAKHFLDVLEKNNKARSAMNIHNNEVGRKAVRATLMKECKCHGVCGSCSTKTCWKQLAPFEKVGNYLKEKYLKAKEVRVKKDKLVQKIKPKTFQPIAKKDRSLVFIESSPDYCRYNATAGSLGVLGRVCYSDSPNYAKCNNLCTACGYNIQKKLLVRSVKCECKFEWCCRVKCKTCMQLAAMTTCHR
ncbi:protein Wnt-8b-like [Actinia tenebrosa]|uniref:Protein Wnt n=1 Tax=Actinia tenebrosa TaxID=6105 RepID=A0A6P8HD36_ACTTE|nr:protein Wnt-8b-like [Actinia tenebrosa]